jgi:thioredoxin-dependent peroxiredoxin
MTTVNIDQNIANFSSTNSQGVTVTLDELKGKNVVVYFYPKDNTPGCTTEGQNFRDLHEEFVKLNTVILGVSRDSVRTHLNFRTKHQFPFELLSDPEETLCKHFDVIKLKKLYGKEYMGIERSTFLIDASGTLKKEWRKVKVKGHVDEVLEAVKSL